MSSLSMDSHAHVPTVVHLDDHNGQPPHRSVCPTCMYGLQQRGHEGMSHAGLVSTVFSYV
jgi:hypothetical protein